MREEGDDTVTGRGRTRRVDPGWLLVVVGVLLACLVPLTYGLSAEARSPAPAVSADRVTSDAVDPAPEGGVAAPVPAPVDATAGPSTTDGVATTAPPAVVPVPAPTTLPPTTTALPPTTTTVAPVRTVTGVGDSIMHGATDVLRDAVAAATGGAVFEADARPGRPWREGIGVVAGIVAAGKLGDVVIVHLGTNGLIDEPTARALLDQLAGVRRVVLVNVRAPTLSYTDAVNAVLAAAAPTYPNVRTVDWHRAGDGHDDWFYGDGIHLKAEGNARYAELLAAAVAAP